MVALQKRQTGVARSHQAVSRRWHDPIQLACYSAQLGQLDAAQEHLHKSYELGDAKQIKLMSLDDEDLTPLWESEAK